MSNISQRVGFPNEALAAITGSYAKIGSPLANNPVLIIFDNQSTATATISIDGTHTWRTFPAGEALVLDLRGNHGIATNFTIDLGTQFWVSGTVSTGNFSISYLYAV